MARMHLEMGKGVRSGVSAGRGAEDGEHTGSRGCYALTAANMLESGAAVRTRRHMSAATSKSPPSGWLVESGADRSAAFGVLWWARALAPCGPVSSVPS